MLFVDVLCQGFKVFYLILKVQVQILSFWSAWLFEMSMYIFCSFFLISWLCLFCFVWLFSVAHFREINFWSFGSVCGTNINFMEHPLFFLISHIVMKSRTVFLQRFPGSVLSSDFYLGILFLHLCVLILLYYNFSSSSFSSLSGLVMEGWWWVCLQSEKLWSC